MKTFEIQDEHQSMTTVFYLPESRSEQFQLRGCLEIFTSNITQLGTRIIGAKKVDERSVASSFEVIVDIARSIKIFGDLANALDMLLARGIVDETILNNQLISMGQIETFYRCLELAKFTESKLFSLLVETAQLLPPGEQTQLAASLAVPTHAIGKDASPAGDLLSMGSQAVTMFKATT